VAESLQPLVNGFQLSQAIHVAATLGIADLLDEPRSADELADATETHAPTLYRLLRALAAAGVFHELDDGRFELTDLGAQLRKDHPQSVHGWAAFIGRPYVWQAWTELLHGVRTGEHPFRHAFGTDPWTWRADHPDESALFDAAMESHTRRGMSALLAAYDFSRFGTIADVGGGNGALLAAIVAAHPDVRGILFDQPHVVANAQLPDGVEAVGGSFFESVPDGADAYTLKMIIHDWEDPECVAILGTIRAAMPEHAAVLVIERALGAPNEALPAKLADLNMFVMPGGRERTEDEYAALFEQSGLAYAGATPTAGEWTVYEARLP
jgi:hypothetical protein